MKQPGLIDLQVISHNQGQITVAQESENFPFNIKRVYWLTDVPDGQIRGNNACHTGERLLACVAGEATIYLEDLNGEHYNFKISRTTGALYIPPMVWSRIRFDKNCLLICLVSNTYNEEDYIRSYDDFLGLK